MASSSTLHHVEDPRVLMTGSPSFSTCNKCNPKWHVNTKNIVVGIDSTNKKNTNVKKLFAKIDPREQHTYYLNGNDVPQTFDLEDLFINMFTRNMERIVKEAYRWLVQTYKDGDRIYLFGFSHGAYQVRMLAEMIHEVGLIKEVTEKQIGVAYDHCRRICSGRLEVKVTAKHFKERFSWQDARVHFVGVWDTVSPRWDLKKYVFQSNACHIRHALALDGSGMPEYFHKMNSPSIDGRSRSTSVGPVSEIKEVWFAGSHSDVGGRSRSDKSYQAGNVSLLWMRREAAACDLKLEPTDIIWTPDDLDVPRRDPFEPRRIIPGQKIHASVLYANSYEPAATFGVGFGIPIVQPGYEDTEQGNQLWETGFFDDTAAPVMVNSLDDQPRITPIFLDRLLFMLRFEEGKRCIRNVPGWQDKFMKLIEEGDCAPLVRLVAIVAFHEASCDPKAHPDGCELFPERLSNIVIEAVSSLIPILSTHKHRDGPRLVALLRPLTKHQTLRQNILTDQVLENLMPLLDAIIKQPTGIFGKAMDGLNCLLLCEDTRSFLIGKLGETPEGFNASRLAKILEADDSRILTAALRVVLTLARIPDVLARNACLIVRPRIQKLATKHEGSVGQLSVEILLMLYEHPHGDTLNIHDARVRANLASVLVRSGVDRHSSADNQDPRQEMLSQVFGLNAVELNDAQRRLIGILKTSVEKESTWERTVATLILLKLCETEAIRSYLCSINLLELFVMQLQRWDSALLAAYALTICLRYTDMKGPIQDNDNLPTGIVAMVEFDYFDKAVGQVEGFQIFRDLMQHADLWKKIENYKFTEILDMKLGSGIRKQIRTGLLCLEIIHSFDPNGPWTDELVGSSLERLTNTEWEEQRAGVAILSALAQTERGVGTISRRIQEIVKMLLPDSHLADSVQNNDSPPIASGGPSSWMLGPAWALCVLVRNETLRASVRETPEYVSLKYLLPSGTLVAEADLSPRRTSTRHRVVIEVLEEVIKVVDEELPEGFILIRDPVPPDNVNCLMLMVVAPIFIPSCVVGSVIGSVIGSVMGSVAGIITGVAIPIRVSVRVWKQSQSRNPDRRALESLRGNAAQREHTGEAGWPCTRMDVHESEENNTVTATFELPGLKPDDIVIEVDRDRLMVTGEATESRSREGSLVHEGSHGKFSKTLQLPFATKPDDVKAKMENGVLTVTFPKSNPEQQAERIAIQ